MELRTGTRAATAWRVAFAILPLLLSGLISLAYLADGRPRGLRMGLPMGMPAVYLLWTSVADSIALVRGTAYVERPRYAWVLGVATTLSVLFVAYVLVAFS